MLDRYLLRYFLAVVDQGNFSRAAAACNVSQPTLSIGIAKLERTVGQQMFVRSNQRVELTDAGARFLVHARRIEQEFNTVLQSMTEARDRSSLRLGVLGSIPGAAIAAAIAEARPGDQHRFELLSGNERELAAHLDKGRIDLALTLVDRGSERFLERPILREGYGIAITDRHPLAEQAEIEPQALANEVMMVRRHCEALSETSRFFTERGVRPHFAHRSTNDERVLQMVAAGLGLTVMPLSYRAPGVARPRLAGFTLERTLGWAFRRDDDGAAGPQALMAAIEDQLRRADASATGSGLHSDR